MVTAHMLCRTTSKIVEYTKIEQHHSSVRAQKWNSSGLISGRVANVSQMKSAGQCADSNGGLHIGDQSPPKHPLLKVKRGSNHTFAALAVLQWTTSIHINPQKVVRSILLLLATSAHSRYPAAQRNLTQSENTMEVFF